MHRRVVRAVAWAFVLLGVFAFRAAAQQDVEPEDKVPRITVPELKKLLDAGDAVVVDVRDAESYKSGHIPGAISIPSDEVEAKAEQLRPERKTIVTYCA